MAASNVFICSEKRVYTNQLGVRRDFRTKCKWSETNIDAKKLLMLNEPKEKDVPPAELDVEGFESGDFLRNIERNHA